MIVVKEPDAANAQNLPAAVPDLLVPVVPVALEQLGQAPAAAGRGPGPRRRS